MNRAHESKDHSVVMTALGGTVLHVSSSRAQRFDTLKKRSGYGGLIKNTFV